MSMRPLSLSTAADSANCGPRGGDKAWTKKFTCLGVYVFFPGLNIATKEGRPSAAPALWNPLWPCGYVALWLCGYVAM